MFEFFAALLGGSAVLNAPAWLFARSRAEAVWWLPLIGAPAIVVWVALVDVGVGPQSLSNIVEVIALAGLSVLFCFAQVFLLNRRFPAFRRTTIILCAALVCLAVLLRLCMPPLPE